jgi:hypothetical protein
MIASPDWITEENALRTTNQDRAGATPCPSSGAAALRINGRRPSKTGPEHYPRCRAAGLHLAAPVDPVTTLRDEG